MSSSACASPLPAVEYRLDAVELLARLAAARAAAIATVVGPADGEGAGTTDGRRADGGSANERLVLAAVAPADRDDVLRRLYWNAWRLGRSAARAQGRPCDRHELATLLTDGAGALPCLGGRYRETADGHVLVHAGCGGDCHDRGSAPAATGTGEAEAADRTATAAFVCDAYREALDGLVCGLGEGVRFLRRESRGRGGAACEDVLHADDSPAPLTPVPEALAAILAPPTALLAARGHRLALLGVAENRLYVRLGELPGTFCGGTREVWVELLRRHLHDHAAGWELVDTSPRAVLAS